MGHSRNAASFWPTQSTFTTKTYVTAYVAAEEISETEEKVADTSRLTSTVTGRMLALTTVLK